jgi:formiminoglutamase
MSHNINLCHIDPWTPLMNFYSPPDMLNNWQCRQDAHPDEYIAQIILPLNLIKHHRLPTQAYGILGFASDAGVIKNFGRAGAKEGPNAIRLSFGSMPYHGQFLIHDAGNIEHFKVDELENAQLALAEAIFKLLELQQFPIVLGGGHETAFGHYQGLYQFYQKNIAIINFDAHFDLRAISSSSHPSTSGTPFRQIHQFLQTQHQVFHYYCIGIQPHANSKQLFDYANHNQFEYLLADTIHHAPNDFDLIKKAMAQHDLIYVSICLDVFAAHIAPGVSAPQALGLHAQYVIDALKLLKQSGKVIALDIVELNPNYDIDKHTAKLAANLLMTFLEL